MKKRMVCILLCLSLLLPAGCGQKEAADRPLTEAEIAQANEAFAYLDAVVEAGHTTVNLSEISCFFTSFYSDPTQIDLKAFLQYCPIGTMLEDSDAEEFRAVMEAIGDAHALETEMLPTAYAVPTHRYRREDVSALLKKYAGITVDDLVNTEETLYLAEYDAFYNFTSDFGPGYFECVGGEKTGDTMRFWSAAAADGTSKVLTVREENGAYLIQSFLESSATD